MGTPDDVGSYPNNQGIAFSQPHTAEVADMDGDGIFDIITGKMRYAHPTNQSDPDPEGPAYLVILHGVRDTPGTSGAAHFELTLVDDQIGVGRHITVGHADSNGIVDICVASKLGLAIFLGQ